LVSGAGLTASRDAVGWQRSKSDSDRHIPRVSPTTSDWKCRFNASVDRRFWTAQTVWAPQLGGDIGPGERDVSRSLGDRELPVGVHPASLGRGARSFHDIVPAGCGLVSNGAVVEG
jgi:hypothetical protein